jgi:hypothetical protein
MLAFAAELGLARTLSNEPTEGKSSLSRSDDYWVPRAVIDAGVDCDSVCLAQIRPKRADPPPPLSAAELFAVADRR